MRKKPAGYLLATVYLVFLSLLMTALTTKVIAMAWLGYQVVPAVFIIPAFHITAIICAMVAFKNIKEHGLP